MSSVIRVLSLLLMPSVGISAIIQSGYSDAVHSRFFAPRINEFDFIGSDYDFSGVAKNSGGQWVTMISPWLFLTARHFPASSGPVTFDHTNIKGESTETHNIDTSWTVPDIGGGTDIWIGKLETPISSNVAFYDIYVPPTAADYIGLGAGNVGSGDDVIFMVGNNNQPGKGSEAEFLVGTNIILDQTLRFNPFGQTVVTDADDGVANRLSLEGGDSGAPTFYIDNGVMLLIGNHSEGGTPLNYDMAAGLYNSEIDAVISAVPEPETTALVILSTISLVVLWRRRR